jgi:HK97 family phage portal protein
MGLIRSILHQRIAASSQLANPPGWLVDWFGGGPQSAAGPAVTAATARTATAVWCAVLVLASTISTLPLIVYRRLPDGGKERVDDHPLVSILHDQPNPWQTIVEWLDMSLGHLELRGNAFSAILYNGSGDVTRLIPLHPDRVRPFDPRPAVDQPIAYEYTPPRGPTQYFFKDDILHLFGHSDDGLVGLSTIAVHRESIGKALALQEYGSRFFGNYAAPGGVLTHPKKLGAQGRTALKLAWEEKHRGLENAHRVAVLEEGMKWEKIGVDNKDAQYLEAMEFTVDEVARIFNVPPHKLHELRRSTNNNIEHQAIEFVQDAIRPRCVRLEKRIKVQLFKPSEQATHFCEFNIDGLLRGDFKSRMEGYQVARYGGIMNADEIRAKENMNPQPDGQGKVYWMPVNMKPADSTEPTEVTPAQEPEPGTPPGLFPRRAKARARLVTPTARMLQDVLERVLTKECKAVRGAIEKHASSTKDLTRWLEDFYEQHAVFVQRAAAPVFVSCGELLSADVAAEIGSEGEGRADASMLTRLATCTTSFAIRYTALHRDSLLASVLSVSGMVRLLETYERHHAQLWSKEESGRLLNAAALFAYQSAGVRRITWATPKGLKCGVCTLHGKTIETGEEFADGIKHPPFAPGCICQLTAEQRETVPVPTNGHPPIIVQQPRGARPSYLRIDRSADGKTLGYFIETKEETDARL